jgi:hypothetical protein
VLANLSKPRARRVEEGKGLEAGRIVRARFFAPARMLGPLCQDVALKSQVDPAAERSAFASSTRSS